MRKLIILITALAWATGMEAQKTAEAKARVDEIRQLYKEAWEAVAYYDTLAMDGLPKSRMVVESDYMASGSGPRHEIITYFFSVDFDEERYAEYAEPYLVTRKYNIDDSQYYEEYLYDRKGKPCFVYWRNSDGDEARYYWSEKGELVNSITGDKEVPSTDYYLYRAGKLKMAFDAMMNVDMEYFFQKD